MNSKKLQRKLKFLCAKQFPHTIDDFDSYLKMTEYHSKRYPFHTICKLFIELNYTVAEANVFWSKTYSVYRNIRRTLDDKHSSPKPERKDNKYVMVGSGGSNKNTIRYPSKKRKTAWKRFYKIFPHLDPKNKKDGNN